ncbi:TlpA disulfide reductase family protein [Anoxynatronum sibiricum]|uniref:TlpA disulfide reductase family protein n=1 Tax=Anoxynatronum sibiricum TaxID=210623 RepID=A0ABU9VXK2_9CLOT
MKKSVLLLVVLLLLSMAVLQACSPTAPESPQVTVESAEIDEAAIEEPEVTEASETTEIDEPPVGIFQGNRAPDFTLYDLEGNQVCLEDLRGNQVVLNFWHMGCPPCVMEKKEIQAFQEVHEDKNIWILSINIRDSQQAVEAYMEENNYTFPVLFDTHDNFAAVEYRVRATPTSVFIDEDGLVKHRVEGAMNVAFMENRLGLSE